MPRWKNSLQTGAEVRRIKREAVLKEAGRAFTQQGYHNTTLDGVADALKVSKGTLYNYFKDKQEILFELQKVALEIAEESFAHAEKMGGTGAEQVGNVLRRYIYRFTQELGACVALIELDALRPKDRAEVVKRREAFHQQFVDIIQKGMQDGSIRSVNPSLAIFAFMGAVYWLPRWYSPNGKLTGEELADTLVDMMLAGIVQPDRKSVRSPSAGRTKSTERSKTASTRSSK